MRMKRAACLATVLLTTACDGEPVPRGVAHPSSEARPRAGTTFQPCGTPLAEVDGVWAYSNGPYTGTGTSCGGVTDNNGLAYQCVEFARRYMTEVHGIASYWPVSAAKQMCTNQPDGVTSYYDDYAPVRGDLAVWGNGTWGHVAVVAEVLGDGIRIVEQNSSAEGTRILRGDPWNGYWSDWGTTPVCYVHADDAGTPVTPTSPTPASPPKSKAQCDALGYDGACYGQTSVWSQDGKCHVRDCASEGRTCGWIADGVGWGCLGGTAGATTFDCAEVGYTGICTEDDTLVWVESGACRVVACPERGQGCGWDAVIGYDCQ